jgi:hypothetical protein
MIAYFASECSDCIQEHLLNTRSGSVTKWSSSTKNKLSFEVELMQKKFSFTLKYSTIENEQTGETMFVATIPEELYALDDFKEVKMNGWIAKWVKMVN